MGVIKFPNATNFRLTSEEANELKKNIEPVGPQPIYTLDDFTNDTGFEPEVIARWERILNRKKHIVFQGPPGTGKTYVAERLAKMMVSGTSGFVETVQFHPAYAYEDFVPGIRPKPVDGGLTYELEEGRFLEFCRRADEEANDVPCILIIDEINRAHLSRVFGELMYLLEYRDKVIPLAAGGEPFRIPENVYLIGTMNTADRSIALVDHALRRRFSFIRLNPDYNILKNQLEKHGLPVDSLIRVLKEINMAIDDPNYELGISFFMTDSENLKEILPDIWKGEIEPYLEEFFYDNPKKVDPFRWIALAENKLKDWIV
ncbi:MAG: AAA domain-containing protein [Methanophagales archaeon]|nr:AAA domain-containing protein [Methanophagales archaeon]